MAMEGQNQGGGFIIPGMRFDPEEEDLLRFYLIPKINGDPLPWDGIKEFDVYGKQGPWEIIHGNKTAEVYVFAISKNKSRSMKQRTCGFGTWKQQKCSPVDHQGQTIGYGSYLSFYPEEGIDPGFLGGSWNMTEYCLKGHEQNEGYVVCKVSFKVWSAKERARRGLEEIPAAAAAGASDIDAARPRKRTKVACGSKNDGTGSDIDAAHPRKKAKVAVCGSSSNNPEATTSAFAPAYINCAAAEATSLDHGSNSTVVEEQQPPAYGFSCAPNLESNNVVGWEAPAASYYENNGYLNLESYDYNDNVADDQYLSSGNIQPEVAAGFDPSSLYFEDYSHNLWTY